MTNPVDLTNLRAMIDNDVELEKELIAEFFRGADACLAILSRSLDIIQQETWRQQAHALKGMALNFGAETLGHLAKDAQENWGSSVEEKQVFLRAITKEYAAVKESLL